MTQQTTSKEGQPNATQLARITKFRRPSSGLKRKRKEKEKKKKGLRAAEGADLNNNTIARYPTAHGEKNLSLK